MFDVVLPAPPGAPFGAVAAVIRDGALERLWLLDGGAGLQAPHCTVSRALEEQLARYFDEPGFRFTLPLCTADTDFQHRVRGALQAIPAGEVRTYGELARSLGTSARAVGGACRANPMPLIVPCHRVVAAAGPGGYAGRTVGPELARKRWLLAHEGVRR